MGALLLNVIQAKEIARDWVIEHAGGTPGFQGAFFHGSVNWLPDDAELPSTSDLDVMLVLDCSDLPVKPGKFRFREVLLEVSHLAQDRVQSAEQVLCDYRLAGSFKGQSVILDPSGKLTELQTTVSREYTKSFWVRRRCEVARHNALNFLNALDTDAAFHDQVAPWLFANGVLTHILLVAGLENPTVRRRYLAAQKLLQEYGRHDFYESLLEVLGCAQMSAGQAERHLDSVAAAFDVAKAVVKPSYQFAADLTETARPVAIDGSRELIEQGDHREAIFWMVATYSRCRWVLAHEADLETQEKHSIGYWNLLRDLGIESTADLTERCQQVRSFLPSVWEVAEAIMKANRQIT